MIKTYASEEERNQFLVDATVQGLVLLHDDFSVSDKSDSGKLTFGVDTRAAGRSFPDVGKRLDNIENQLGL